MLYCHEGTTCIFRLSSGLLGEWNSNKPTPNLWYWILTELQDHSSVENCSWSKSNNVQLKQCSNCITWKIIYFNSYAHMCLNKNQTLRSFFLLKSTMVVLFFKHSIKNRKKGKTAFTWYTVYNVRMQDFFLWFFFRL